MLPFSFLDIRGPVLEEILNHFILIACQMIESHVPEGMAEVKFGDKLWMVYVKTDFTTYPIGPSLSGILFNGRGEIRQGENNILSPFGTEFLLDSRMVGWDLVVAMDDPDRFLKYLRKNCSWLAEDLK